MSNTEFGSLTLFLFLLLALARILGNVFTRLRQPRVIGEILAGVVLGPSVLGHLGPKLTSAILLQHGTVDTPYGAVLSFLYNFGLLLLMFASGAETKSLFSREDRKEVAFLGTVGTGLPFLIAVALAGFLPLGRLAGPMSGRAPLILVISIGVAVTSIPVISKILHDLGILHTRFARLILGVAVIEDVILWVMLAIATALAKSGSVPQGRIAMHVAASVLYFGVGLVFAPKLLRRVANARWNILATSSPVAYVIVILLAYAGIASLFDISIVFAAYLAGYGLVSGEDYPRQAIASVTEFSFAVFIPIYFAMVGYKLDLTKSLSLAMVATFLLASSAIKLFSAGLGARMAGFGFGDSVNLAAALNARGGPGIVLASVAFDAGIVNAHFYTALVITAVLTSQAAGAWLEYILRSGRSLLAAQPTEVTARTASESSEWAA